MYYLALMSMSNTAFLFLFFLLLTTKSFSQERTLKPEIVNKPPNPATVITRTIEAINQIRNAEYIWRDDFTIPYMPTVFHEPFVSRAVVSMNKADTIQGARFKYYLLEDTFRLQLIYDGRYIARVGWRPCVQAVPFLKQLRDEYAAKDLALVSIEPFIGHASALKEYKLKYAINYPLLLADAAMKKYYAIAETPVFMIVDKSGVIREIITGFHGKSTEAEIRVAIGKLTYQ